MAVAKANRLLGLIKRCFSYIDIKMLRLLFVSIVRPHLEYANVIWHPMFKRDVEMLEEVQHRATRIIPELRRLPYEERLRRLRLPTLVYRRKRGDVIEVYKLLHGMYQTSEETHLCLLEGRSMVTTGHGYKLDKLRVSTKLRENFFGARVVRMWNRLPDDVVSAASLNSFKNQLDRHWGHLIYKEDVDDQ
jgi:hypothetical protein